MPKIMFVFKMVMSLVYVGLGLMFILNPKSMGSLIPEAYTPVLGLLLIIYGLFRGYRAYVVDQKK